MTSLLGEITLERLMQWRAEHAGQANAGQARMLIKSLSTGHATMQQVLDAIGEFERLTGNRETRHAKQVWVFAAFHPVDGMIYENLMVWQPSGNIHLARVQFVEKAPRGTAMYHVMQKRGGSEYSQKIGSFVEVK